jgi:hypothetical protein
MCSIHLDESTTHLSKVARPSWLCILFIEKLHNLLDHLDNRRMMHGSRNIAIDCWCGNRNGTRYYSHPTRHNYKYAFCRLGFPFLAFSLLAMDAKRGTKHPRSPSAEGSPLLSDAKNPPPTPSGSPPPPGSLSEISSCCPHPLVFEQGGPSRNILVIDLSSSSDQEDFFVDTSRDGEFARRLFGDLLVPSGDGKVILLSDSNEEEEEREETNIDADAAPYAAVKYSTLAASTADVDEDLWKM